MANPQIERGHTDIANELAEAYARFRIAGEEWQVLWVVLRKTYGWHKKSDQIALSQFVQGTGMQKPHIIRAIKKLVSRGVLVVSDGENGAKVYEVQKDFDLWIRLSKKETLPKRETIVVQIDNKSLSKKVPTKETRQKKPTKEKYLDSVYLTQEEHEAFVKEYGQETTKRLIAKLNHHKMAKGTTYKSDYYAILSWVVEAVLGNKNAPRKGGRDGTESSYPVDLVVST